MTTPTLEALLARVEAAEGGSREIDVWMAYTADFYMEDISIRKKVDELGVQYLVERSTSGMSIWRTLPEYSRSVDAALALVERVLPGWGADMEVRPGSATATLWCPDRKKRESIFGPKGSAKTLPAAILSAALRALIAQETEVANEHA